VRAKIKPTMHGGAGARSMRHPSSGASMALPLSDDEAGRQILGIFVRHRVPANGTLKRIHFFDVRDSDFQRGINSAVAKRWITVHHRDRYCYILTDDGYAAGRQSEVAAARAVG
jgi:hypothetical protein